MVITATMFWLILLVFLIIIEIVSMGLTTIWFAGGALVAMIAAAIGLPFYLQLLLFIVVSLVLLFFTRPVAMKYFNKDRFRTNVESMLGRRGVVTSAIDNLPGKGRVMVNGMEWSARSVEADGKIEEGAEVVVRDVSGVKLIVEERKEGN